jgi:hypothetical protein
VKENIFYYNRSVKDAKEIFDLMENYALLHVLSGEDHRVKQENCKGGLRVVYLKNFNPDFSIDIRHYNDSFKNKNYNFVFYSRNVDCFDKLYEKNLIDDEDDEDYLCLCLETKEEIEACILAALGADYGTNGEKSF